MNDQDLKNNLLDYVYGDLPPEQRSQVEAALQASPEAREEVRRIQALRGLVTQALPMEEAPHLVRANILREARKQAERYAEAQVSTWDRVRSWLTHPSFAVAATAALVVLVAVGVDSRQSGEPAMEAAAPAVATQAAPAADAPAPAAEARYDAQAVQSPPTVALGEAEGGAAPEPDPAPPADTLNSALDEDARAEVATGGEGAVEEDNTPTRATRQREVAQQAKLDAPAPLPAAGKPIEPLVDKNLELAKADRAEAEPAQAEAAQAPGASMAQGTRNMANASGVDAWAADKGAAPRQANARSDAASSRAGGWGSSVGSLGGSNAGSSSLGNLDSDDGNSSLKGLNYGGYGDYRVGGEGAGRGGDAAEKAEAKEEQAKTVQQDAWDLQRSEDAYNRALLRQQRGDLSGAASGFDEVVQNAPRGSTYHMQGLFSRGFNQQRLGNHGDAAGSFRAMLAQYPQSPRADEARFYLAKSLLAQDPQSEEARLLLDDLKGGGGGGTLAREAEETWNRAFGRSQDKKAAPSRRAPANKAKDKRAYDFEAESPAPAKESMETF